MSSSFCSVCDALILSGHCCPPLWDVWDDDDGERGDNRPVRADSAELAAVKWVEENDQGDYHVAAEHHFWACKVARVGSDDVQVFEVHGDMLPQYWAEEVEIEPEEADEAQPEKTAQQGG